MSCRGSLLACCQFQGVLSVSNLTLALLAAFLVQA